MRSFPSEYSILAQELVRSLRGSASQSSLNLKIGSTINQLYRWESGYRQIKWQDFLHLCAVQKIDMEKILKQQMGFAGSLKSSAAFVRLLKAENSIQELSELTKISRSVISKWLHKKAEPTLAQMLYLIDCNQFFLLDILGQIVELQTLPSLSERVRITRLQKEIHYQFPIVGAIFACLELEAYRTQHHRTVEWVAETLQVEPQTIHEVIEKLLEARYIEPVGTEGGYKVLEVVVDTRGDFEGSMRLKKFWHTKGVNTLDQITSTHTPHLFPHCIFTTSDETANQIRQATYEYFTKIRTLVVNDKGKKSNLQMINVQEVMLNQLK